MKLRKRRQSGPAAAPPTPAAAAAAAAAPVKRDWRKYLHIKRRNKLRLWVALYKYTGPGAKGGDDAKYRHEDPDQILPVEDPEDRTYHWALLVGPKHEDPFLAVPGSRLEVTSNIFTGKWIMYRHLEINIKNTGPDMLVRMLIGKIADKDRFYNLVYGVPVDENNVAAYRNRAWLFETLTALRDAEEGIMGDGCRLDWMEVSDVIKSMCRKGAAAGRLDRYWNMNFPRPAFDLLEGRFVWDW